MQLNRSGCQYLPVPPARPAAAPNPPATPEGAPCLTLAARTPTSCELEIKRSRFLAHALRTDSTAAARDFVAAMRQRYPDARHHSYAFQIGISPTKRRLHSSDDGEPAGTAGQPIRQAICSNNLTNTTVVVTRYFGGTLLGAGPLARAYGQAAAQVLQHADRVQIVTQYLWALPVPMDAAGRVEAALRAHAQRHPTLQILPTQWGAHGAQIMIATPSRDVSDVSNLCAHLIQGSANLQAQGTQQLEIPL